MLVNRFPFFFHLADHSSSYFFPWTRGVADAVFFVIFGASFFPDFFCSFFCVFFFSSAASLSAQNTLMVFVTFLSGTYSIRDKYPVQL